MLEKLMKKLCEEWKVTESQISGQVPGCYSLPMDQGLTILVTPVPRGFSLKCSLGSYPNTNGETYATNAMLANLFGQGTQGATLGLSPDGNTMTLTRIVDYDIDYREFHEILDDFISAMDFWVDETVKK